MALDFGPFISISIHRWHGGSLSVYCNSVEYSEKRIYRGIEIRRAILLLYKNKFAHIYPDIVGIMKSS